MKDRGQQVNEAALVSAAREGDRRALGEVLGRYGDWLKGMAYNMLGNAEDVDEALQTIFLTVVEKIGTLREPERFKGWLGTVARNALLAYREQRSRRPVGLEEAWGQESEEAGAEEMLEKREMTERILAALKGLPEKYREVFVLKHMNDMSYAEMAEVLEVTVTTVQIRLVRARRMIHNTLHGIPNDKIPRT